MVTTLAPCWYCSGLVRQFGFGTVIVGESRNFQGGLDWLRSLGVKVIDLDSQECVSMLSEYIRANPAVWNEDIGLESPLTPCGTRPQTPARTGDVEIICSVAGVLCLPRFIRFAGRRHSWEKNRIP